MHAPRGGDEAHACAFVDLIAERIDLGVAGANQLVVGRLRRDDPVAVAVALVKGAPAREPALRERSVNPELIARGDGERCVS